MIISSGHMNYHPAEGTRSRLLDSPRVYDLIQMVVGGQATARRLRGVLAPTAGREVLDVGAGTGSLAALLPPGAHYTALDSDPGKLRRLEAKLPGTRCLLRSGLETGLEDRAVDWTVCVAVTHHLDDEQLPRLVAELARITRERLVFLDALWTGRWDAGRLLWRYDRGSHPRPADALLSALHEHFALERIERYRTLHEYVLCVGRPVRS
jgi:SAM-dependent methyltransferase